MNTVLRSLNTLLRQIDGAYHDAAVQMGVSDSVMDILYGILAEGDGCNQSVLYKNTGTGKTTVNSAIRRMEKDGLLYLKPGEGRNTRVFLTDKGRMASERTAGRLMRIEEDIIASWTEAEQEEYLRLMQRYFEQFAQKMQEELKAIPHNCGARIALSGFSSIETKTAGNPCRISEDFCEE